MTEMLSSQQFDTAGLLDKASRPGNDDPGLKSWLAANGRLCVKDAIIAARPATPGERVLTWVKGPNGEPVLERDATAKEGEVVIVGPSGEQYISPQATLTGSNVQYAPVEGDRLPQLPDDEHTYEYWRSDGTDYRMVAANPTGQPIYLGTSKGGTQEGQPDVRLAARLQPPTDEAADIASRLDVVRFIGGAEFEASFVPASPDMYRHFGVPMPVEGAV